MPNFSRNRGSMERISVGVWSEKRSQSRTAMPLMIADSESAWKWQRGAEKVETSHVRARQPGTRWGSVLSSGGRGGKERAWRVIQASRSCRLDRMEREVSKTRSFSEMEAVGLTTLWI